MADSIYTFDPTPASNTALDSIAYGPNQLTHGNIDNLFRAVGAKLAQFVDDLGAVNTVAGTANAITVTLASGITAYATGQMFRFVAGSTNTGAATLNVNSIGAKAIRKISGGTDVALGEADLVTGRTYRVCYDADANSSAGAWVVDHAEVGGLTDVVSLNGGPIGGFRNKIINGRFQVNVRTTGSGTIAAGTTAYICDRWFIANSTDQTLTWSIGSAAGYASMTDPGDRLSLSFAIAPTSGTVQLVQRVEDVRTLAGRTVTAFARLLENNWGVGSLYIDQNFGSGGSATVSAGSTVTTTGAGLKSGIIALPTVSGKTIGTSSYLVFALLLTPRVASNAVITNLGLVEGDATAEAEPFSPRHIQQEKALCRPYARRVVIRHIITATAVQIVHVMTDISDMRALPIVTATPTSDSTSNVGAITTDAIAFGSSLYFRAFANSSGAGAAVFTVERLLDAEL